MKKLILLSLLLVLTVPVVAQNWVAIPDANFANRLNQLFPECMDGNQMNTECATILNATELYVTNLSNPDSLKIVDLTGLQFFVNLEEFSCAYNLVTELPELPQTLTKLSCYDNNLTYLPELPQSLTELRCKNNNLTGLPNLPQSLTFLNCNYNNIVSLPELPETLTDLWCVDNNLIALPELPQSLTKLWCFNNNLSLLPDLPQSLTILYGHNNNLTALPNLPSALSTLRCENNQIACLPTLPMTLILYTTDYFDISNNPFTCLPNYLPAMNSGPNSVWLSYPLCDLSDLDNNPYGCRSMNGIVGTVFKDGNTNCEEDEGEVGLVNVPVHLLDSEDNLIATTYTLTNNIYNFVADTGMYTVQLDLDNQPYQPSCSDPGSEEEVVLSTTDPSVPEVNFGVECLTGFDVGTQSITTTGWVFPGQEHTLKTLAGDLSDWYGLQCAEGVSGSVTINITGPVEYIGPAGSGLTPTVTGDIQLTYDIENFGNVDFDEYFHNILQTDTTAEAEDLICIEVIVEPIDDDINPDNNTITQCYEVVNSYDPNIKQVWPQNVEPGYDDYFSYTIYFQNTGTAPAFNIRVADTLDTNLDLSTFEVTAYSHECLTYVSGNVATFRFNNIMLPDSTSDFDGSIGYVQYRIKPIADLPVGTVIENTAHIFFDFNDAIVTNTTQNEYVITTSVVDRTTQSVQVFPNPGTGLYNLSLQNAAAGISTIEVFTLSGVRVAQQLLNSQQTVLDLTQQPPGMYLLRVQNELGSEVIKIVKH